jgi:hypothetical protein
MIFWVKKMIKGLNYLMKLLYYFARLDLNFPKHFQFRSLFNLRSLSVYTANLFFNLAFCSYQFPFNSVIYIYLNFKLQMDFHETKIGPLAREGITKY